MQSDILASPVIQYGFAGFSVILLAIVVWLIMRVIDGHDKALKAYTNATEALTSNTAKLSELAVASGEFRETNSGLRDELMRRPCMAKGK